MQYGTKPEGRLAAITSLPGQRPATTTPATTTSAPTTTQSAQSRGKSPVTTTTTTATSHGKIMGATGDRIADLDLYYLTHTDAIKYASST